MSSTPDKSPEGPYKPIKQKLSLTRWSIKGPTHSDEWFLSEEAAQRQCYELNAAFAAGQAAGWISAEDLLPEEQRYEMSDMVLMQTRKDGMVTGFYSYRYTEWRDNMGNDVGTVTHWQPLPPSPSNT